MTPQHEFHAFRNFFFSRGNFSSHCSLCLFFPNQTSDVFEDIGHSCAGHPSRCAFLEELAPSNTGKRKVVSFGAVQQHQRSESVCRVTVRVDFFLPEENRQVFQKVEGPQKSVVSLVVAVRSYLFADGVCGSTEKKKLHFQSVPQVQSFAGVCTLARIFGVVQSDLFQRRSLRLCCSRSAFLDVFVPDRRNRFGRGSLFPDAFRQAFHHRKAFRQAQLHRIGSVARLLIQKDLQNPRSHKMGLHKAGLGCTVHSALDRFSRNLLHVFGLTRFGSKYKFTTQYNITKSTNFL